MTTLGNVLRGVRDVMMLNDRLVELTKKTDRFQAAQNEMVQRLVRAETFIDFARRGCRDGRCRQAADRC